MRFLSTVFIVLLIFSVISSADKGTIAVLDLEIEGVSEQEASYLTRRVRHELFLTGKYTVLERAEMEEILSEQGFQLTGCTSSECAVQAGQLLGVQKMVGGSVGKIGGMYTIFLRLIDVQSGAIVASATADCHASIEEVATKTTKDAVAMLLSGQVETSIIITKDGPKSLTSMTEPFSKTSGPLLGMEFVTLPSDSFLMGSNDGDDDEKPIHSVNIKSFQIMTTEVTQAMWKIIMKNNPSYSRGDNLPVEKVSWNDCQEFIEKLNRKDPGKGYRLPTEAEWEYACRAGTTTNFYSGDSESDLDSVAWYKNNSGSKTHQVGQKSPNAWGLYDMHGNIWEWCEDWYHSSYEVAPKDGSAWILPAGKHRVMRGGAWSNTLKMCRFVNRDWFRPDGCNGSIGFRLVRNP